MSGVYPVTLHAEMKTVIEILSDGFLALTQTSPEGGVSGIELSPAQSALLMKFIESNIDSMRVTSEAFGG